jgi:hypothetical protein
MMRLGRLNSSVQFLPHGCLEVPHSKGRAQEPSLDLLGDEISGYQNDLEILLALRRDVGQFDPGHVGHADIRNDHAKAWGPGEQIEGMRATTRLQNVLAQILKELRDDGANLRIIVHDQDLCSGRSPGVSPGALAMRRGVHVFPQATEGGDGHLDELG